MLVTSLLTFFAILLISSPVSGQTIQINIAAILLRNDTLYQQLYVQQYQYCEVCRCVWNVWRDRVLVRGGIQIPNGPLYIPNFVPYVYDLTLDNATAIANDLISKNFTTAFMGLYTGRNITTLLGQAGITMIHLDSTSVICSKTDSITFGCVENGPLFQSSYYPIAFPDQSFTMSSLRLAFLNGARSISFIYTDVPSNYYGNIVISTLADMKETLDIKQVNAPTLVPIGATISQFEVFFMEASRLQPDILMIMIRDGDCANMFEAFSKVKWTPKTAYTLFCHSTSLNKFKTFNGRDHFFIGPTLLFGDYLALPNFTQLADTYISLTFEDRNYNDLTTIPGANLSEPQYSFDYFREDYTNKCSYLSAIDNYSTRVLDCMMVGEVFEEALILAAVPTKLANSLSLVAFKSVYGYVTFNKRHTRDYSSIVDPFQINQDGDPRLVGSIWATTQYIYPMPTFAERIPPSTSFLPAEIAIFVLTGVTIVLCLIALIFTVVLHKTPVIRASSPIFLGLLCIGCAVAAASNFFTRYSFITTHDCYLHIWFLAIGYILSYGALFVRTLKIDRLWNAQTIDGVQLSDQAMIAIFLVLVFIQAALCGIWSGIARPQAIIVVPDPLRPNKNYYQCSSGEGGGAMIGIIVGFCAIILFIGSVLAYRVRSVPMKVVNESKIIAISVYNLLIISVIILILVITNVERSVLFVIKDVLVLCAVLSTLGFIFISKITADISQDKKFGSSVGTVATMLQGTTTGTTAGTTVSSINGGSQSHK